MWMITSPLMTINVTDNDNSDDKIMYDKCCRLDDDDILADDVYIPIAFYVFD